MSDGRFSSKPIRRDSLHQTGVTAKLPFGPLPSSNEALAKKAETSLLRSAHVQRIVNELMYHPMPAPDQLRCERLPAETPREARHMGAPIALAIRERVELIRRVLIRCAGGLLLIFSGPPFVVFSIVIVGWMLGQLKNEGRHLWLFCTIYPFVLIELGFGAWLAIFLRFAPARKCWFCPGGVVCLTGKFIDWCVWERLPELYFQNKSRHPALGIRVDGVINWFPFNNESADRQLAEFIENRASAAWMPTILQQLAEGRTIQFGECQICQESVISASGTLRWKDVDKISSDESWIVISDRYRNDMTVSLEKVPFPSLFRTLVLALQAYSREVDAKW
jgi:hypothetical protein